MSEENTLNLGTVSSLSVHTYGEPGKRTFNIQLESAVGKSVIWLEKESLVNLAFSLKAVLEGAAQTEVPSLPEPEVPAERADVEFKALELKLAHDSSEDTFVAAAIGMLESGSAIAVLFRFSRDSAKSLLENSLPIIAAGRPRCPLCNTPMAKDDSHFCPHRNGHRATKIK